MGSHSSKYFNHAGHPSPNVEDEFYRGKFPAEQPPNVSKLRPLYNADPLYNPAKITGAEYDMAAKLRAVNSDCIRDTLSFMFYPTLVGTAWGAAMAAAFARPDTTHYSRASKSGIAEAGKGILRELAYLKSPMLFLGGYAGLFAVVDCTLAKWREYDGIGNSSFAAGVAGLAAGIQLRSTNKMFMFSVYGAVAGALVKWAYLSGQVVRPKKSYYELLQYRKDTMRPEIAALHPDGYMHTHLDPKLEQLGVKLPDSWKSATAQ